MAAALGFEGDLLATLQALLDPLGLGSAIRRKNQGIERLAHDLRGGVVARRLRRKSSGENPAPDRRAVCDLCVQARQRRQPSRVARRARGGRDIESARLVHQQRLRRLPCLALAVRHVPAMREIDAVGREERQRAGEHEAGADDGAPTPDDTEVRTQVHELESLLSRGGGPGRTVVDEYDSGFRAVGDPELSVDGRQVELHGVYRQAEDFRDPTVRASARHET